jgi:hypothetical protein
LPAACEIWPAIASARPCASLPSVSARRREPAPVGLLVAQLLAKSCSCCSDWPVWLACARRPARSAADARVDQVEAAEDVGDVLEARAATNAFSVALSPATKREFFQASKYSDIVGVITTSAVKASCGVGFHCARRRRARRRLLEVARGGDVEVASGSASPNSTLPSPSRSGLHALGGELRLGAEDERLDQVVEVARLLERAPVGRLDRERHGVLGSPASPPASMITS